MAAEGFDDMGVRVALVSLFAAWSVAMATQVRAGQFSGRLDAISDYVFRGIDRTDGPAAQGEITYLAASGGYAGAWASNARAVGGSEANVYAGYGRTVSVRSIYSVHLDSGLIGYLFANKARDDLGQAQDGAIEAGEATRRHNLDFAEVYASARLGPATLKAYVSPDYANAGGVAAALRGTLRWPLLQSLSLRIEGEVNLGPGLRNYTARLSKDAQGHNYFDYLALLDYALPADVQLSAGVAGTTFDVADGRGRDGSQPRLLLELSKRLDF